MNVMAKLKRTTTIAVDFKFVHRYIAGHNHLTKEDISKILRTPLNGSIYANVQ
jgi:hypothetical protein